MQQVLFFESKADRRCSSSEQKHSKNQSEISAHIAANYSSISLPKKELQDICNYYEDIIDFDVCAKSWH